MDERTTRDETRDKVTVSDETRDKVTMLVQKRKKQGKSMTIVAGDENNRSKDKENEVVRMVTISDCNK